MSLITHAKLDIRLAQPREYIRQRIAESAASLSLAGLLAARVELANESIHRLTELLYQADADGGFANVDSVTYRLLIPAPWGARGCTRWGLRHHEAETLRHILRERLSQQGGPGQRPPLFDYNEQGRTWHLNALDYPSFDAARFWLRGCAITLTEWRTHAAEYRKRRVTAVSRSRQRLRNR